MKHHNETLHRLSRRLDPIWWLVSRVLRLRRDAAGTGSPESILVVHMHLLGDVVMLIPFLRVIRRYHPQAHVALMAGHWAQAILADTYLVDEFIPMRAPWVVRGQGIAGLRGLVRAVRTSRRRTWDWGVDMRGDVRNILLLALARAKRRIAYDFSGGTAMLTDVVADDGQLRHIIDHHAAIAEHLAMSMTDAERVPTLTLPQDACDEAETTQRAVGFHFGASMVLRRMPVEEACALILSMQDRDHGRLILIDAPDTRELNRSVLQRLPAACAERIETWQGNLRDLMTFLGTLDKFYAMDSGPAHLAAALGVDTTVFFGPHVPGAVRPLGRCVTIVERRDLPCRPCDQHHCTNAIYQECLRHVVGLTPGIAS